MARKWTPTFWLARLVWAVRNGNGRVALYFELVRCVEHRTLGVHFTLDGGAVIFG